MPNPQRTVTPSPLKYSLRPIWPQGVTANSEAAPGGEFPPLSYVGDLFAARSVPFSWTSHNWLDTVWEKNRQPCPLGLAEHGQDRRAGREKKR